MRRHDKADFIVQFDEDRLKNPSTPNHRFSDLDRNELAARLERLADVRPMVVARGRALIASPAYPDRAALRAIGRLLAHHMAP